MAGSMQRDVPADAWSSESLAPSAVPQAAGREGLDPDSFLHGTV